MSSIPSLESIYGSLTADITANTAKLERLGHQTDIVEDEFGEEDNVEKSEDLNCTVEVVRWCTLFLTSLMLPDVSEISKVLTDIEKAKEEAEDVVSMRIEVLTQNR